MRVEQTEDGANEFHMVEQCAPKFEIARGTGGELEGGGGSQTVQRAAISVRGARLCAASVTKRCGMAGLGLAKNGSGPGPGSGGNGPGNGPGSGSGGGSGSGIGLMMMSRSRSMTAFGSFGRMRS